MADIFHRLGRQVRIGPCAGGRFRPALEALIDRLNPRLGALRGRQVVDIRAIQLVADTDLELLEPVQNVELGQGDAVMPEVLIAWRTSTASNQPQRRGRPVTVPNSWPRSPSVADVVFQLGRKRPGADPGGIGLGDTEHIVRAPWGRCRCRLPPGPPPCWTR